jgi:SAM-dependent methyltransferase
MSDGVVQRQRAPFQIALEECVRAEGIDLQGNVLVIGGSLDDADLLRRVGFRRVTLSNLGDEAEIVLPAMNGMELDTLDADAEDLRIPEDSYDLVLAHAVLHHCESPHKALLEMLRVSRRRVIFLEPADSLAMRAFVKLRFSFPYELPAVIANDFVRGGVRNSCIPNYIFRWSERELFQTTASYMPEAEFNLYVRRYWDMNIDKEEMARRSETRIGSFSKVLGPELFSAALRTCQWMMNHLPGLKDQGNKFFGCVTKQGELKPWLVREGDGIAFNRGYTKH